MSITSLVPRPPQPPCRVLIVDDDRRVRELLEIALTTHGFGVISAADGDEGLLRAQREKPDLVLLDVRLPKKSGLEVCDALRNDPTDPGIPIILISALAESDHRLQGFLRGADDYLAKPFSPKELVARVRRLLARATETRAAVRRALDLEREIASLRREARRADDDARREHGLRDVAGTTGRDLLGLLDLDELTDRLLGLVHVPLRAVTTAVLVPGEDGALAARAVRGDRFERARELRFECRSPLGELLTGLARPVRRDELERIPGITPARAALVGGRWDLLVPLVTRDTLEGLILVERGLRSPEAGAWSRELEVLGGFAALALKNAQALRGQSRRLIAATLHPGRPASRSRATREALEALESLAHELGVSPAERDAAAAALELAPWPCDAGDAGEGGAESLDALAADDPGGLVAAASRLLGEVARDDAAERPRIAVLAGALLEFRHARARGVEPGRAWTRAGEAAAADPFVSERMASRASRDAA